MKTTIHPKFFNEAVVTCACGNTFTVGSTKAKIDVEICAKCHPFFTGEMRFVDTMGRVEKFVQKRAAAPKGTASLSKKVRKQIKKRAEEAAEAAKPKNLKEMFDRVRSKVD
jgi:large subunit ribosomal protein L31